MQKKGVKILKTVVIVDNNKELREQIKNILNNVPGVKVIGTSEDGERGIIDVRSLRPDIVITDIKMPKADGTQLIRHIVSEKINYLPHFIVITSQEANTIVELRELPVRKVFNKPFAIKDLADEVVKIQQEERVSVIIADDNVEFSEIIKNSLSKYEDIDILGIANTDEDEVSLIENLKPDIVITDLLRNGEITAERIIEQYKSQKFLVVSYSPYATPETRENVVWSMQKYNIEKELDELAFKLRKAKANMVRLKLEDTISTTEVEKQEKGIWEKIKEFFKN